MSNTAEADSKGGRPMGMKLVWGFAVVFLVGIGVMICLLILQRPKPPILVDLGDGRILQIEGVTYGTTHRMGGKSLIDDRLGPWLPRKVKRWFEPKRPESKINSDRPALVVWVTAIDARTGSNVDCQTIRAEFVDRNGDLYSGQPHWGGFPGFWRVGHVYNSYPKDERELLWQITAWRTNKTSQVKLLNPHLTQPVHWSGSALPQTNLAGELELVLSGLNARTNGGEKRLWETPVIYWEPAWEFWKHGMPAPGWAKPEWVAEDALGNRSRFPGLHQKVLRFSATVYPEATNIDATLLVASLPGINLSQVTTNVWWNRAFPIDSTNLVALGVCPAGSQVFSEGEFDPNAPRMGAVRGGAPSGWTGQIKRVSPVRLKEWSGHYSSFPTIYLRAPELGGSQRIAVRFRDDQGHCWNAKHESQGAPHGIHAFMIELPNEVTNVSPEIVLLKPFQAEFLVDTAR